MYCTLSRDGVLQVDPSIYESPASMTTLSPLDVVTTDVEIGDDEEISN